MLAIDTLHILRYDRVVWHPLIPRYSYSTRKRTFGCANTNAPTSTFIYTMKKIQHSLHTCIKGINIPLASIVFPLSECPVILRNCWASPGETDDVNNFLWRLSISHCFPDKSMARSWISGNSKYDLFLGVVVSMWFSSAVESYGSLHLTASLSGTSFVSATMELPWFLMLFPEWFWKSILQLD